MAKERVCLGVELRNQNSDPIGGKRKMGGGEIGNLKKLRFVNFKILIHMGGCNWNLLFCVI